MLIVTPNANSLHAYRHHLSRLIDIQFRRPKRKLLRAQRKLIRKFSILDLSWCDSFLKPYYAGNGRPAWMPSDMLDRTLFP